jgi:hypothetical protein
VYKRQTTYSQGDEEGWPDVFGWETKSIS